MEMWLSDTYDVPQALVDSPPSPAFRQFLLDWFGSGRRVSFSERLSAARKLSLEETTLARELVRRNLRCKHSHIISGTWVLGDAKAVPMLRGMFDQEPDESRRLLIAGALWKLNGDPIFIESLHRAKVTGLLKIYFHLTQVLWLNDERAVDFLIDLLPETDHEVDHGRKLRRVSRLFFPRAFPPDHSQDTDLLQRGPRYDTMALNLLNHLETGHVVPPDEQRPPSYYRHQRNDQAFSKMMLEAVNKFVAEMHQGR